MTGPGRSRYRKKVLVGGSACHALSRAHVGRRSQGTGRRVRAQALARGFGHGRVSHHCVGLSPWSHAGDVRARRENASSDVGIRRRVPCRVEPCSTAVLSASGIGVIFYTRKGSFLYKISLYIITYHVAIIVYHCVSFVYHCRYHNISCPSATYDISVYHLFFFCF